MSSPTASRKIRLLIITHVLDKGGVEEVILTYAKFLDKQKYIIMVACRVAGLAATEISCIEGVSVVQYEAEGKWNRCVSLLRIARKFKPDIVHNHFDWYGLIVGRLVHAKCVETIHNTYHWLDGWQRYVFALSLTLASRIIAVSQHVLDFTMNYFPLVDRTKMTVIHNGIDILQFRPSSDENDLRKELSINKSDVVIGFIGRLEEQKGLRHLLDAIKILNESFPNLKLIIVGDGSQEESLHSRAKEMELLNVRFCGFQRRTLNYYQLFDVFVLPSLFEGLPVSIIQAMAAGCPVVASRVGGVMEIVENDGTGILVDAAQSQQLATALRRLVDDPALRRMLGEQGRRRALQYFSAESMVRRTEVIYAELLGRSFSIPGAEIDER